MSRERLTSQEPNVVIAKELFAVAQLLANQNDKAMENWPVENKDKVASSLKEEIDEDKTATSEVPVDDTKMAGQNDEAMKNHPVPNPEAILEKEEKVNTASMKTAEDQNAKANKNWPVADKEKVASFLVKVAKQFIAEDQNAKAMKNCPVENKEKVAAVLVKIAKEMI